MKPLKIYFLGGFEVYLGDRPLPDLRTRKIKSLFAYLVTHRRCSHPREVLAEMFWGDLGAERARNNLRYALSVLRHTFGPHLKIERHQAGFNAQSRYWLDAEEFECLVSRGRDLGGEERFQTLCKAVDLYRGDFLYGFYDDWVLKEQARLERLYLEALDSLALWPEGPFLGSPQLGKLEEAGLKRELARAHYSLRNPERASAFARRALRLYQQAQDLAGQGETYLLLGVIHRYLGQNTKAAECYRQALAISRLTSNLHTEWRALNNLGWLEWNLRSPRRARRYLGQALAICQKIEERWGEAVVLNNYGIAYIDEGEHHRALERLTKAYQIIASLDNDELKLENMVYRAVAQAELGGVSEAERSLSCALKLLDEGVGAHLAHRVHLNLWRALRAVGRPGQARCHLQKAYEDVMARAAKIKDPSLKESFLTGDRSHREIIEAWEGLRR